jgi:unsaturated chondroitin disaccharide hydrolase
MPTRIDFALTPDHLVRRLERMFELSAARILALEKGWDCADGAPVFTAKGRYTARGWTEWTQGFQFGSALLQFDATGEERFLELGRRRTVERMAGHVSHIGVHDHGFNNVSTYGNLLRLLHEGRVPWNDQAKDFYELALKISGAVQAARWTRIADGSGFIHSFNGAHSLFVDTIRSCRVLALAHQLGHTLKGEQDATHSLLQRLIEHARNTARYSIYYGTGRDAYDVRGRTAHESLFNPGNGVYRCPSTQQGYSPFSTWTRGLAWAICGFAEQLEFLATLPPAELQPFHGEQRVADEFLAAATATADFYVDQASCADGIPMWDTGAPNLHRLASNYLKKTSDPTNAWEPVDSSAAAIAAQGLWRLGRCLEQQGARPAGRRYRQAALTIARTLLNEPYLSTDARHQGLLLHSVYHRPNGWDYIAPKQKVPNGESSMWGDYHLRELGVLLWREAKQLPYLTFFGGSPRMRTS